MSWLKCVINSLHAGYMILLSADFFQNFLFFKNSFVNTIRVSNGLDPDQDRHFVSPGQIHIVRKDHQPTTKVATSKER